ncbi:MAG: hypothetical protein NC548_16005 [Lachnospiraceae bacterium]|nr:hypothetical protein [Lachnospiraceae bacterium]
MNSDIKDFISCSEKLPELGYPITILLKDGSSIMAMRTESGFDDCGYVYEDINCTDHFQKDVIGWHK